MTKFSAHHEKYGRMIVQRVRSRWDADRKTSAWATWPEPVREALVVSEAIMASSIWATDSETVTLSGPEIKAIIRASVHYHHVAQASASY